jgi:hypothetical protein
MAVILLATLYLDPHASLFPPCPIHQLLGMQCPGCGATRAIAALLHGDLRAAFHLNSLFLCALPALILYAAIAYRRALAQRPFTWPRIPMPALYLALTAITLFTVARNI